MIHKALDLIELVPSLRERSQISYHKPILKGNQGVGNVTCIYCHQMGHLLNRCPVVDDRLR
jgi:hypothetical protein